MPTIYRAENAVYAWLQKHYPRITDNHNEQSLFEYRRAFMNSDEKYRIDLSLMRRDMFAQLGREFGYEVAPLVEQSFELFYRLRHDVEFYDDVFPVLRQLAGRYRLGSISNGNADAGLTPLQEHFDYHINAADVMARKPDARIFEAFCQAMDVEPGQCVYVGDDPNYDIIGAQEVGMHSVWINRQKIAWPKSLAPPQAEITNLFQLLELLEKP